MLMISTIFLYYSQVSMQTNALLHLPKRTIDIDFRKIVIILEEWTKHSKHLYTQQINDGKMYLAN